MLKIIDYDESMAMIVHLNEIRFNHRDTNKPDKSKNEDSVRCSFLANRGEKPLKHDGKMPRLQSQQKPSSPLTHASQLITLFLACARGLPQHAEDCCCHAAKTLACDC